MKSGKDLCDGLIILPESPTGCSVPEYDCEASKMMRFCPTRGCCTNEKKKSLHLHEEEHIFYIE